MFIALQLPLTRTDGGEAISHVTLTRALLACGVSPMEFLPLVFQGGAIGMHVRATFGVALLSANAQGLAAALNRLQELLAVASITLLGDHFDDEDEIVSDDPWG